MVCFGSDPLLGQGDPARGKEALAAIEFYVHMDFFANPSAMFPDLLLPASMSWETESVKTILASRRGHRRTPCVGCRRVRSWSRRRPVPDPILKYCSVLPAVSASASTFLAATWTRRGGICLSRLVHTGRAAGASARRESRGNNPLPQVCWADPQTGRPRGFATPSRKLELYSIRFAGAGFDPLPRHDEPAESPLRSSDHGSDYPLILTSFRHVQYVSDGHRNVPRLRNEVRDPLIEIHPDTAASLQIGDGDWVNVETASGKVKFKAKYSDTLHPKVVCAPYGWWQACAPLGPPCLRRTFRRRRQRQPRYCEQTCRPD